MTVRRVLPAIVLLVAAIVATAALAAEGPPERPTTRQVMLVGNNWDGTADVVDTKTYERLGRLNIIPDKEERLREIRANPVKLGFYLAIGQLIGEGHDQYVDDMFTTHDGRLLAVSRPSFADVVGIDLETRKIVWRFPMEGYRADHMAVSPSGEKLLVSDSTANKVHELDLRTGRKTGEFASGDSPHENTYTPDGKSIYHASIGRVYTPLDLPKITFVRDTGKGASVYQKVDADSLQIVKRWNIGEKLKEAGYPDMSPAVRPAAYSPDGRFSYLQVSFHHGFVEFDLEQERVTRVANLPLSEQAKRTPREGYLLDSAHHGLAMNDAGTKLCAAGTMSDYAAIVSRSTFASKIIDVGRKPYWSTTAPDGKHCWVSSSGDDRVVVIDYDAEKEVARIPVGDHPQRVRAGVIDEELLSSLPGGPEGFKLGVTTKRSRNGLGVARNRFFVGCRTTAQRRHVDLCKVRVRAAVGGKKLRTIGTGSRTGTANRAPRVTVKLNRTGRSALRRRAKGVAVRLVVTGRDDLGRERTVTRKLRLRRAR